MRLTARRLRAALDFVRELYARLDGPAFAGHAARALPRLVPADICSFNEIEPSTGRSRTVVEPAGADEFPGALEIFERHVGEHPAIRRLDVVRQGGAWRVSDLMPRREFERLPLYNEYYRRIGTEHQVVVALPGADASARGFALSRGPRDFSDGERAVLTVVAPHLVQAYANAGS